MHSKLRLPERDLLRVAITAPCSPNTARRYFRGQRIFRASQERIERALREHGLEQWLRPGATG